MPKVILTDSGFWLGLMDPADQHHEEAVVLAELIRPFKILIPWSCLYEIVTTRLTRRRDKTLLFQEMVNKANVELLDDSDYRAVALQEVFNFNQYMGYSFSLVDSTLREVIKDVSIRVHYLLIFNHDDFADVCSQRRIEILGSV